MGLLAGGGVALGVRLRGAHQPGRHVLHGVLHAAPVHDAGRARRPAARRARAQPPRAHAARDAAHVRLPYGWFLSLLLFTSANSVLSVSLSYDVRDRV